MQKQFHLKKLEEELLLKENSKVYSKILLLLINVLKIMMMISLEILLKVIKEIKYQDFLQCSALDLFLYLN